MNRPSLRRLTALVAVVGASAAVLVPAVSASAAPIGSLTFVGLTSQNVVFDVTTSAACPSASASDGWFTIRVSGPGITGTPNIQGVTDPATIAGGTTAASFTSSVQQTLAGFATNQGLAGGVLGNGTYTMEIVCRAKLNPTSQGEFVGSFTVAGSTVTPAVPAANTTTEVIVPATSNWGAGAALVSDVTNSVNAADHPTGSVQFKADGTAIGSPVTLVSGEAILNYAGLGLGSHSITAEYTPTGNFNASSSTTPGSINVVISGPVVLRDATISGTARVGGTLSCATGTFAGATSYTYEFLKNGVVQGVASSTFTKALVVSDLNSNYSCRVTGINPVGSVQSTSTALKVTAGVAAVATVKPKIAGTAKVGRVLSASKGTWSPAATYTYTYTWKRGSVIVGRAATYRVVAADRLKLLTVTVTAARSGYLTGTATSAAVKAS